MRLCAVTDRLPTRLDMTGIEPVNMQHGSGAPIFLHDREPGMFWKRGPEEREARIASITQARATRAKSQIWEYNPFDAPQLDWPGHPRSGLGWLTMIEDAIPVLNMIDGIATGCYWSTDAEESTMRQWIRECFAHAYAASCFTRKRHVIAGCVSHRENGEHGIITPRLFRRLIEMHIDAGFTTLLYFSDEKTFNPTASEREHAATIRPFWDIYRGMK